MIFQNVVVAVKGTPGLRARFVAEGHHPDSVKILQSISVVVAETEAGVRLEHERLRNYAGIAGQLALYGGWTDVDLSGLSPTAELDAFGSEGIQHCTRFFGSVDGSRRSPPS